MKVGYGDCNGTFGELVQGILENKPFLLTFPISELKTKAVFIPQFSENKIIGHELFSKAILACQKLLTRFNLPSGGYLRLYSSIPRGKGMASSSADIVASIVAVADSYSLSLSEELISEIASDIEPTDGVMYKDIVAYDYLNGTLIEKLGKLPPYHLIGFDLGGTVDTVLYNQQKIHYTSQQLQDLKSAYDLVKIGIKHQYLPSIMSASTISARINEQYLPKPLFHQIDYLSSLCQGGIVTAHSGTILGILYDPKEVEGTSLQQFYEKLNTFAVRNQLIPRFYSNTSSKLKNLSTPIR
ncbi:L-threonine kinase [Metabacillus crassostreae]|uniref:GHMP family kinase ATP-binding protein n=1 Tax=Metabacillus crassostreae TaxID=929098 RepID=UPI00195EE094|nr:hypothetical protein [Metabacillus crassostreae]MBM7603005.1 L-threonine kinase [Metabacillus crassostreae]